MGITAYQKEIAPGVVITFFMVVAEAINRYTGLRVQKKRRNILSKFKALHVYKELWSMCREEKPDGFGIEKWDELIDRYFLHLERKVRSSQNPLGYSPRVIQTKRSRINHLKCWNDTHLDLITPQFVSEFLDRMEKSGSSRLHTNHLLKEVKCVFSFALQTGEIKVNLFAGMKMRRVPKKRKLALTHEEVNQLLREAKLRGHPFYYIWLLTLALGLRRSELAGLKWIDIDFDQRLIYLRRQLIPGEGILDFLKDREERVVAIPRQILPTLKELRLQARGEFVVELQDSRWLSGEQAKVLREFCRLIGIKEVTHHQLRATHITLALIDGIPLGIVKENVGHAKLSTTDEYFRSAGINMKGQTDGLRIKVPESGTSVVIPISRR